MTGRSKKPGSTQHDGGASSASEDAVQARTSQDLDIVPSAGSKRMRQKHIISRGKRPSDIDSNEEFPEEDDNAIELTEQDQSKPKRRKTGENEGPRNRASPARIFKLNKGLVVDQNKLIKDIEFSGLLDIAATSMPGDLIQ